MSSVEEVEVKVRNTHQLKQVIQSFQVKACVVTFTHLTLTHQGLSCSRIPYGWIKHSLCPIEDEHMPHTTAYTLKPCARLKSQLQ